jgi:hypothetical protein
MMMQGAMVLPVVTRGHDRAVCDAKFLDSIDLKLAVYDRHGIAPHFRGTRLMMVSGGRIANEIF